MASVWAILIAACAIGFFSSSLERETLFLDGLLFLVALVLPLILITLVAMLAAELERQQTAVRALAELVAPLIGSLDAARATVERHGSASPEDIQRAVQGAMMTSRAPEVPGGVDRIVAGLARLETAVQRLEGKARQAALSRAAPVEAPPPAAPAPKPRSSAPRTAPLAPPVEETAQPPLPLEGESDAAAGPDWADFVRALDFPRDAEDNAGFRALKSVLRHHDLAQMLQAAEDVLTLLSQEGVYMDDLAVAPVDPRDWRRFINGGRGPEVAGLGGIGDPVALDVARGLMRSDPIFRDTALFFQRRFDAVLSLFAERAGDAQLVEVANTRSGRAFMLLARLSGSLG